MDPFEEFEFKPLTDGLGFHKKKPVAQPAEVDADSFSNKALLKNRGLDLIEETPADLLRPPLPRKNKANDIPEVPMAPATTPASTAVDEILKTLQKNRHLDFEKSQAAKKVAATKTEEYKLANWNFSSGLLDAMLVIAASLLCMIILLVVTRADLIGNLTHPDQQGMIYLSTFSLFAGVAFVYLVVNRMFLGYTPGEWAFDQRIGKPQDADDAMFSLKVAARSALVVMTGFVLFPLISLILGYDLAGAITNARLMKKA